MFLKKMKNKLLYQLLQEKKITFGAVESMTGGLFSKTMTDLPGISSFFKGALIAYQEETKINILKIDKDLINKYGVVSKEVAVALAKAGQKYLNVHLCIAITGNAGPSVEKDQKEIGEVYYAISYLEKIYSYELKLVGPRNKIREKTVKKMIESIISILS